MTVQAGLLTRGSTLYSAFPGCKAQWPVGKELTAYSCGRSCGFDQALPHSHVADLAINEPEHGYHPINSGGVNTSSYPLPRCRLRKQRFKSNPRSVLHSRNMPILPQGGNKSTAICVGSASSM
jgi:hypothetical protein